MASSSTRPFSCPNSRPTSPGRSSSSARGPGTGEAGSGAAGADTTAGAAAGTASMIASTPASIFEDDLNSFSLSFVKNAMGPPSRWPCPNPCRTGMQTRAIDR